MGSEAVTLLINSIKIVRKVNDDLRCGNGDRPRKYRSIILLLSHNSNKERYERAFVARTSSRETTQCI